jgi:shikimate 5-dehydrogenase/shikimate kinase
VPLVATVARARGAEPEGGLEVPALADLVELRLDLLPVSDPRDVGTWVAASPRPVLATVRSAREGGSFRGSPAEAAAWLLSAAEAGAAWLDAEADVVPRVLAGATGLGARVLASVHAAGRDARPPAAGVSAWKVARPCASAHDVRAALAEARDLAARSAAGEIPPATLVPYGVRFAHLRVVTAAIAQGAGVDPFVFGGRFRAGPPELPGQPPLARLVEEGRLGEISGSARLFALVGGPPGRSPSPRMHNAAFRALGEDAVYLPAVDLPPSEAFRLPFAGFSVTTPWKERAARACDRLEPSAARIGAVNTVVRASDGALVGSNTDAEALAEALRGLPAAGRDALVIGRGGFARAAATVLSDAGFSVRHDGREPAVRPADALAVNATPAGEDGTLPGPFATVVAALPRDACVVDAPYRAGGRSAAFADACRARGVRVLLDGPSLLVAQAKGQVARFTGRPAPALVLEAALRLDLGDPHGAENLVLVGARGAGKTSVGRAVAGLLGRPFVDTDDEVGRRAGRPAGRVLAERGEAAFRALEREEVLRAAARVASVVAVGGGALATEGNARALAERAFVVFLSVSAETAARRIAADATPRPRLTDAPDLVAEGARLLASRRAGYESIANATVVTDGRRVDDLARDVAALLLASRSSDVRVP